MSTVYDRVKIIVSDKLDVESDVIEPGSSFVDDLNADSLDLAELVMALEEEFSGESVNIEISDDDAGRLTTIQSAVDYLKSKGITD